MVDNPQNIEHFNLVVLKLLDRLYGSFPRPLDITDTTAINIGFDAVPENATEEESWDIGTMAEDIIGWLSEEGFLRYQTDPNHQHENFWKVRLTLKGLTILGYVPSSLQQPESKVSLIHKARQAIGAGTSAAGKEAVQQVVAEIFKLVLAPGAVIAASTLV